MEVQLRHHLPQVGHTVLKFENKGGGGDVGGILLKHYGGLVVPDAVLSDRVGNPLSLGGTLTLGG